MTVCIVCGMVFFRPGSAQRVELSPEPIFTSGQQVRHLDIPVPPELQALREKLGFDYGKFDYTMVEGRAMPFDFKQDARRGGPAGEEIRTMARQLAGGFDAYFS